MPQQRARLLLIFFFLLGRFLDRHIVKFFGIKYIPALKALDELGVFVSGDNSNPGVFAGGNHRIWHGSSTLAADFTEVLNICKRHFSETFFHSLGIQDSTESSPESLSPNPYLKTRQKRSYT